MLFINWLFILNMLWKFIQAKIWKLVGSPCHAINLKCNNRGSLPRLLTYISPWKSLSLGSTRFSCLHQKKRATCMSVFKSWKETLSSFLQGRHLTQSGWSSHNHKVVKYELLDLLNVEQAKEAVLALLSWSLQVRAELPWCVFAEERCAELSPYSFLQHTGSD